MNDGNEVKFAPKPLEDLSDFEISELTESQIARCRSFAAMTLGIAIPPEPPTLPPKPEIERVTVHKVTLGEPLDGYVRDVEIAFETIEAATAAAECLRKLNPLLFRQEYIHNATQPTTTRVGEIAIVAAQVATAESFAKNRAALESWSATSRIVDEATKRLDDAKKKLAAETKWIDEKIATARSRALVVDAVRRTFAQYLDLAGGDRETAIKFLRAAYTIEDLEIESRWNDGKSISALDSGAVL